MLWLPPYPSTPFLLGPPPTRGCVTPFAFGFFLLMPSQPTVPRALVHAAAAWHRFECTPLMRAAANGYANAIELLVQMGAAVNAQDYTG